MVPALVTSSYITENVASPRKSERFKRVSLSGENHHLFYLNVTVDISVTRCTHYDIGVTRFGTS